MRLKLMFFVSFIFIVKFDICFLVLIYKIKKLIYIKDNSISYLNFVMI